MLPPRLGAEDALILVDVQNDFCPGGQLPIAEGDQVVPVLNHWIEVAQQGGAMLIATRDWHPAGHISFRQRGGAWPVHCVQNTPGADFHPDLHLPTSVHIVSKGTDPDRDNYSPFDGTRLAAELHQRGIERLWVGGLAEDVCVRATILDALRAGFKVHLIQEATRAVNVHPGDGERAVAEMHAAGCIVEDPSVQCVP